MPVTTFNAADAFINHRTSEEGGGGYFKSWKDGDKDADLDLFLHTTQLPVVVWVHPVPKFVLLEDKDTKRTERRVFSDNAPCWEAEELLKKQHFRFKDSGKRKEPPKTCGLCKLWDWVRDEIAEGRLSIVEPLFRFVGDRQDDDRTLHAGGLAGYFKDDKLDDQEKAMIRKAGISLKHAFRENITAKPTYVFTYVNADKVEDGVVASQETGGLGDQVQTLIANAMSPKALGREKGDPFKNPYGIQFQSRPNEQDPKKKYGVARLDGLQLTPKIAKLIRDPKAAPDTQGMLREFDQAAMRVMLERACVLPKNRQPPWAELFKGSGESEQQASEPAQVSEENRGRGRGRGRSAPEPEPLENDGIGPLTEPNADGAVFDRHGDEVVQCEAAGCGKLMRLKDPSCPHCGHVYEQEAPPAPPPPPPMRTRSQAASRQVPPSAPPTPRGGGRGYEPDDGNEDEIPFVVDVTCEPRERWHR